MNPDNLSPLIDDLEQFLTVPNAFTQLRSVFVELAMQGRLVKPTLDDSVDNLLSMIESARKELGLKRPNSVPYNKALPQPAIPNHWRLVQLDDVLAYCRNGTSATPNNTGSGYRLLRISAGTSRGDAMVDLSDHKFVVISDEAAKPYILEAGDLLVCRFNGNLHFVGRASQVPETLAGEILHPDKLIRIRAIDISHAYLRIAMNSSVVRRQVEAVAATTAGNIGINGRQVKGLHVPIPPVQEQEAIAAKVDEVLALVDELESRHVAAQARLAEVLDAVLA